MHLTKNGVTIEVADDEIVRMVLERLNGASYPDTVRGIAIPALGSTDHRGYRFAGIVRGADGKDYKLWDLGWSDEGMSHAKAGDYAKSKGGARPSIADGRLLDANIDRFLKDKPSACFWLDEQHEVGAGYAWVQYFVVGLQYYDRKDDDRRARVIRREAI